MPMIKEKGFDNVSVDEICAAAGIAKGTFYHYFESKEKIFGETGIMLTDMEFDHLLEDEQTSCIDKILYISDSYMQLAETEGIDITRQIFKSFIDGSNVFTEETSGTQVLSAIVNQGIARNEINPDLKPEEVIDLIFAFTTGEIIYWLNSGDSYDLVAKSHHLLEKWLRKTLANE